MVNMLQRISRGDLDLGVCSGHLLPRIQSLRLNFKILMETPLAIFIPKSNPLSQKERIAFSDLRQESFVTFSQASDPPSTGSFLIRWLTKQDLSLKSPAMLKMSFLFKLIWKWEGEL